MRKKKGTEQAHGGSLCGKHRDNSFMSGLQSSQRGRIDGNNEGLGLTCLYTRPCQYIYKLV